MNMIRILVCLLFGCYFPLPGKGQVGNLLKLPSAEIVNVKGEAPFSFMTNPALLAFQKGWHWGLGAEKRISMPGWVSMLSVISIENRYGKWGLGVAQEGIAGFSKQQGALTHARELSDEISMGVTLGFLRNKAAGYAASIDPIASVGMVLDLTKSLQLGLTVSNDYSVVSTHSLTGLKLGAGFCFRPSSLVNIRLQCLKESGYKAGLLVACSYRPSSIVKISMGVLLEPQWGWMAMDFSLRTFSIRLQAAWNPLMGMNSGLLLYGPDKAE